MLDHPQIRVLAATDLDAIIGLAASIPEAPRWPRSAWEQYLADAEPPRRVFLAESGRELTGFLAGQMSVDMCELESIAVAPIHRRSGIATALLAALIDWARQRGASKVQLEVRCANDSAVSFYENSGFVRDGLRPRYYSNPEDDAMLMALTLAPPPQP